MGVITVKKSIALIRIKKALKLTTGDDYDGGFTCNNLFDSGFPYTEAYWYVMFQSGCKLYSHTIYDAWCMDGWLSAPHNPTKSIKNHRLMMLAWLYEMVRSGEFTRITGVKFTK